MALHFFHTFKLETKLTLFTGILFLVPLLFASIYIGRFITEDHFSAYQERALSVAHYAASLPRIVEALQDPARATEAEMNSYLEALSGVAQVRYIALLDAGGRRLNRLSREVAPEPRAAEKSPEGGSHGASTHAVLEFTQRVSAPVYTPDNRRIGAVEVGFAFDGAGRFGDAITDIALPLQKMMFASMLLGLVLVIFMAQNIKKILLGLEPDEIATLLQERSAMLQMMGEGVLAIDLKGRITLVNDEAKRILRGAGFEGPFLGKTMENVILVKHLAEVMRSGKPEFNDEQNINGTMVLASHMPVTIKGAIVGAISTFQDMSEVRSLAERITDINRYVDALRSQSHEFMNRLHVIMGLLGSGKYDELRAYVEMLVEAGTQEDKSIHEAIKDPVIAGFLASKYSNARELGVAISFDIQGCLPLIEKNGERNGLITILGNLIDNAMDAMRSCRVRRLSVVFAVTPDCLSIRVADSGTGIKEAELPLIFSKSHSTKGEKRGLGLWLVKKTVDGLGGSIELDSRPGEGTVFTVTLPPPSASGARPC